MAHHRRNRHWSKEVVLAALSGLVLLSIVAVVVRAYIVYVGEKRLAAVVAELDESEPGWRWEDVQARREVIPDDENSALIVFAATKLVPRNWPLYPITPTRKQHPQMHVPPSLPARGEV